MVYTTDVQELLGRHARIECHFGSRADDELVERVLPDVQIIVGQTAMPEERLDRAPNLRAILNVKANWEPNIDYAAASRRGIYVLSAAPAMAPAVAEYCVGQAISLGRGLASANADFRDGTEQYGIAGNQQAMSLYDANVGMIGFGNLGRALVPLLRPFNTTLSVYDPWVSDRYLRTQGLKPAKLDNLLSTSQYLFILAGVTSENKGFLNRSKLDLIYPDACVVLASRAEVVDFDAFIQLAASNRFRAAVDVYPAEPVPSTASIRNTPNVLFSSHLAGGLHASYARIRDMMVDDVIQILSGLPPLRMQRAEPNLASLMRSR